MDWLLDLDRELFLLINGAHAPWADAFMAFVSLKTVWIPPYLALFALLVSKYGWREALVIGLAAGLMILATDQVASSLIKPWAARLRPCHAPELAGMVHLVKGKCGGQYGFVSSHAANFFGLAVFAGWLVRGFWRRGWLLFGCLALVVGYSRVYLGVHYPSDILAGGLLGGVLGGLFAYLYLRNRPKILRVIHRDGQDGASRIP